MKSRNWLVVIPIVIAAACSSDEAAVAEPTEGNVIASLQDFEVLQGEKWEGTLTYLDYSSPNRVSIPINIACCKYGEDYFEYVVMYPDEPQYDTAQQTQLSAGGTKIDEHILTSRSTSDDGALVLTTEGVGDDNGQTAWIRTRYTIGENVLSISKDVRDTDSDSYFNRNIIELRR